MSQTIPTRTRKRAHVYGCGVIGDDAVALRFFVGASSAPPAHRSTNSC